jgi:predicted MFS family arabinose efflux permease
VRRGAGPALLLALAVGLVLSDSSVVTLALPAILREFDAGVAAVAWVLIAFNLALALAAVPGARLVRSRPRGAFAAATVGFAIASLACAAPPSLDALVAARVAQGVLGALLVAAALELLLLRAPRRRAIGLWAAAGVLGGAIGPALGGILTEAFSWQAMFALQAPVALLALLGLAGAARSDEPRRPIPARGAGVTPGWDRSGGWGAAVSLVALALVSAALSAALFLLVVMLIEGWRLSPGEAALVVTVMPLAALVAGRWAQARHRIAPALPGCVLLAGGLAALGLLAGAGAAWTIAPQLAIGAGLGLALGALIGATVEGRGEGALGRPAAWTVAARHAGIVAGLLVLTPIFTADLENVTEPAQRAGLSRVLDAPIALKPKFAIGRALSHEVSAAAVPANERADAARRRAGLAGELDRAATSAFSRSFLVAALLALLAAGAVAVAILTTSSLRPGGSLNVALPAACAAATLLVGTYVALGGASFGPTGVADPCAQRARPAVERTQRVTLAAIDGAACKLRTSREQLLLALLDRRRPQGVSEDELRDAIGDGIDRAQDEGQLGGLAATGLRLALRVGGALGIVDRLLPG